MQIPSMTQAQLRAATSDSQLCYVNAGPGSGKTFLAAEAFGYLRFVRHRHAPGGVVGVTFARSARRELERRIQVRWGVRSVRWPNSICTFDELHRRLVRYLDSYGLISWPGGTVPDRPEDSWAKHPGATSKPGKAPRCILTLDDEGDITTSWSQQSARAPSPTFVDRGKFWATLAAGHCTHTDIRNVLAAAMDESRHPLLVDAIQDCLAGSICHLIVDEAFDMNGLDIAVVRRAIQAGVPVTIVGDPWQSLYEFRGSSPKDVRALLREYEFSRIDMPGTHRYKTDEMLHLAGALFHGVGFQVQTPEEGDEFDVVLGHDWGALWAEQRVSIVPAGIASRIDRGLMASTFVLLVNEVVQALFGIEVSGLAEATRALEPVDSTAQLAAPLRFLWDADATEDEIWRALRDSFQLPGDKKWAEPGLTAKSCLSQLIRVLRQSTPPILGLTVHQAKGLEWDRVLLLDGELTTSSELANVLDVDEASHRGVYVGLTRARASVRVLHVAQPQFGAKRSAIQHIASQ